MFYLLLRWLLNALALMLVDYLLPGVEVASLRVAIVAAVMLGLLNAAIRPILLILALPVTILTLGLFIFVINALIFWLVARLLSGFYVADFWSALGGSILYSVFSVVISWIVLGRRK